ncbi:hypothetical protein L2E82_49156 [Cichorium intybus]|uniref:Uncharacterized protein n=1 Tax=Cichorium intybus TaxID=13427 RepID=A0ACB8Z001_CICIN|nr:hypothetical protein L2E82_49156 [Cichorium intybus]
MERCCSCGIEYFRVFEAESVELKETSRRFSNADCDVKLKETVLDWEDAFPPEEMNPAEVHYEKADVVLCLGTRSLLHSICLSSAFVVAERKLQKTRKQVWSSS